MANQNNNNLNSKIYKDNINDNINMIPGDHYRSPDESFKTLVLLDFYNASFNKINGK